MTTLKKGLIPADPGAFCRASMPVNRSDLLGLGVLS
jgi:hypothetical protein